jgi:predicted Zn-dependent protease
MRRKIKTLLIIVVLQVVVISNTGCFESEKSPSLGDYAKDYLQDTKYTRLIIEIDYVDGYAPSSKALDTLESRINTYCDKEEVLILQKRFTSSKYSYSDDDIRDLEKEQRNYQKKGDDIVAYVLYLDGTYSKDDDVLGLAYGPSSIAIFKEKIDSISIPFWATGLVDTTDYEKSVLVHEFGHLLALVNIGYESDRNHESSYRHHCKYNDCVMYYSVETVSIKTLITQENPKPPSNFCNDCQYDLSQIKNGYY